MPHFHSSDGLGKAAAQGDCAGAVGVPGRHVVFQDDVIVEIGEGFAGNLAEINCAGRATAFLGSQLAPGF